MIFYTSYEPLMRALQIQSLVLVHARCERLKEYRRFGMATEVLL